MEYKRKIEIYTDGACSGNPGPGGYAAIILCGKNRRVESGGEVNTTNNRMEMRAAIEALNSLKYGSDVTIYSDNKLLVDGANGWVYGWIKKVWVTSKGEPVKNSDLWSDLMSAMRGHKVVFKWIKGHSGDDLNEEVDALAKAAIPS